MDDDRAVARLRTVANYQFGAGAGDALFPPDDAHDLTRTASGRVQQAATADGDRLVSLGTDGRLTLSTRGGRRLLAALDPPAYRVVVGDESEPYVRDGRNAFAKFVREVDPEIRGGDEVLVTTPGDVLLAVGRAELDAGAMADFESGVAVKVREGAPA